MFNFVNLQLILKNGDQIDNGWWLKVTNEFELMDWWSQANNFGKVWYDLKMAGIKHSHFKSQEAFLMDFKCSVHPEKTSFSNMDLAQMYNEMKYDTKSKMLDKYGVIYINKVGGFCVPSTSISEENSLERAELIFPQIEKHELKIEQFPGGTHFYPSINGIALVINGVEKYDTKAEAQRVSEEYLKNIKVKSKEDDFND